MKGIRGILTGAMVGAAVATVYGMMNRQSQAKLRNFASQSSKKMACKANELFGK